MQRFTISATCFSAFWRLIVTDPLCMSACLHPGTCFDPHMEFFLILGRYFNYISANTFFKSLRSVQCDDLSLVDYCYSVAKFVCLFHIMGGKDYCDPFFFVQLIDIVPEMIPCLRIKAKGWFIQEQHLGFMQQSSCYFQPPSHSSGVCFY